MRCVLLVPSLACTAQPPRSILPPCCICLSMLTCRALQAVFTMVKRPDYTLLGEDAYAQFKMEPALSHLDLRGCGPVRVADLLFLSRLLSTPLSAFLSSANVVVRHTNSLQHVQQRHAERPSAVASRRQLAAASQPRHPRLQPCVAQRGASSCCPTGGSMANCSQRQRGAVRFLSRFIGAEAHGAAVFVHVPTCRNVLVCRYRTYNKHSTSCWQEG